MKKTLVFTCAALLTLALCFAYEATAKPNMLDSYASHIGANVKRNYRGKAEWSARPYSITARIEIDQRGRLLGVMVTKASGNRDFDNAVVRAIRRAGYFGPPPVKGIRMVGLRFNSKMLHKT